MSQYYKVKISQYNNIAILQHGYPGIRNEIKTSEIIWIFAQHGLYADRAVHILGSSHHLLVSDNLSVTCNDEHAGADDTKLLIKIMNKSYLINISLFSSGVSEHCLDTLAVLFSTLV